jgi:D-alanyl-D-alanine carboxypeptidase
MSKKTDYLVLVNEDNRLPDGYEETVELMTVQNADGDEYKIEKKTYEAFLKLREDVLKDTPKPTGGSGKNTITKEQFRGMSTQERYEFSVKHPDEYKELYGGN